MKNQFSFTVYLISPLIIEHYLQVTQNTGNMGLHGAFLDIYKKRNLFYFSLSLLFVEYVINHTIYCMLLVLLSLIIFIKSCIRWSKIILYNSN
jgi:hypothetical protein